MDVVSASERPNGPAKSRPVPAHFLPAPAAGPEGRPQVVEKLHESQRNTNVMEVTYRSGKLRQNINRTCVLCRPDVKARRWPQGPIPGAFPGCPGGHAGLKDRLLQCRKFSAIGGLNAATPSNVTGLERYQSACPCRRPGMCA